MAAGAACPVDHKSREAWLEQARAAEASSRADPSSSSHSPFITPSPATSSTQHHATSQNSEPVATSSQASWSSRLTSLLWSASPAPPPPPPQKSLTDLDTYRVVSSIPRGTATAAAAAAAVADPLDYDPSGNKPVNQHEMESAAAADAAAVSSAGNWVYPSEKMFFDAMKRKGHAARPADMKTVVPIHNAVNERAWKEIQEWEAPYLAQSRCGGPKLESFANKNDRMTPTARINTLIGFSAPFDRHDWVIDRCGTRIEYVIDFYAGRPAAETRPGVPSFYLHVRPKLNTWEGVKMRAMRLVGLA